MLRKVELEVGLTQLLTIRQNSVNSVITFRVDIVSARFFFCQTRQLSWESIREYIEVSQVQIPQEADLISHTEKPLCSHFLKQIFYYSPKFAYFIVNINQFILRLNWNSLSFVFANNCLQVFYKKSVLQNSKILHESTVTRAYLCCRHPRESAITKAPIVDVRLDSKYTSGK